MGNDTHDIDGNRLTILAEGPARLAALVALIDGATSELRLLYYIVAPDASGRRVRDAAIEACRRGVRVTLLIDGFGSADADDHFFAPLVAAGGRVIRFLPRVGRRYLLRNHQKLALADATHALIGGFNIEDDYFADGGETMWRDLGLAVEGPAATHLAPYFDALADWAAAERPAMRTLNRLIDRSSQPHGRLRWLMGGPTPHLSPWAHALRADIRRARRLDMIAAYFTPGPRLRRGIGMLARRGAARIVTAAKSDNSTTIAAARHTYAQLLRRGVRVFEYQPERLHTKLYVADDAGYVGSANCDMRSLFLNLEIMLRVEDAGFARALRGLVDDAIARSSEATPERLKRHAGMLTRLRWSVAYFIVAGIDVSLTRRLNIPIGSDAIVE